MKDTCFITQATFNFCFFSKNKKNLWRILFCHPVPTISISVLNPILKTLKVKSCLGHIDAHFICALQRIRKCAHRPCDGNVSTCVSVSEHICILTHIVWKTKKIMTFRILWTQHATQKRLFCHGAFNFYDKIPVFTLVFSIFLFFAKIAYGCFSAMLSFVLPIPLDIPLAASLAVSLALWNLHLVLETGLVSTCFICMSRSRRIHHLFVMWLIIRVAHAHDEHDFRTTS